MPPEPVFLDATADIVSAFVGHNSIRPAELPELIAAVHNSLTKLGSPPPVAEPTPPPTPAVLIRKSITPEFLISLEDGRRFKALKRHLSTRGMTPDGYRAKWGLPPDYPMVAPSYAAERSRLAIAAGLGSRRRNTVKLVEHTAQASVPAEPASLAPAIAQTTAPKRRGRPPKAMKA